MRHLCGYRAGFTLVELMVAAAILSIMGVILVQVFGVSRSAFDHGSARIAAHKFAVLTMDKITPKIVAANPDPAQGDEIASAIYMPTVATSPTNEIRFVSSMNHFGVTDLSDLDNLNYFRYRIAWQNDEILFQQYDPGDPNYANPPLNSRRLARSTDEGRLENVSFGVYGNDVRVSLQVSTEIRGATGQRRDGNYRLDNVTPIPYFSTKTTE